MRQLFKNIYFKISFCVVMVGMILILFFNWVRETHFAEGFSTLNDTLMPIYIGCFIAFIMCPIYNRIVREAYAFFTADSSRPHIEEKHEKAVFSPGSRRRSLVWARVVATVLCIAIIIGFFALIVYFVLPQLVASVVTVIETMPQRLETFSSWSSEHLSRWPALVKWINSIASSGATEVIKWIQVHILNSNANGISIAQTISQGVLSVVQAFMDAFIGLLIAVYLLNYKERLFAIVRKLIESINSEKRAKRLYEFGNVINTTFIGFIVGRILDALVIFVLTYVVLRVFGISMPLLIAAIVGVTNVIPFFGPFLGAIPSACLLLLEEPIQALWFIIIIFAIQQLDGNVIGPKIVGNAIGIPSFWVLLAVLIGGGLFGFLGMFLAAPVFAVFYTYADRLMTRQLQRRDKSGKTYDYYNLDKYGIDKEELEENDSDKGTADKGRDKGKQNK